MKKTILPQTNHLTIPTREEQHRTYSGLLTVQDFNTSGCAPYCHVKKTVSALRLHTGAKGPWVSDDLTGINHRKKGGETA